MLRASLVLASALLGACGGVTEPADAGAAGPYGLTFVSLITGRVEIVETATLRDRLSVTQGHGVTLGTYVLPGQRRFYYGNQDTVSLDRIDLAEDLASFRPARSLKLPVPITGVTGARGGSLLAVTSQSYELPVDDRVLFVRPDKDDGVSATFSIPTSPPALDMNGKLARPCPCPRPGVAVTPDGTRAFVTHQLEHTVWAVDPASGKPITSFAVEPAPGVKEPWLGPSGDGPSVSDDGVWLAVPGLEAQRVLFVRAADPSVRTIVELPGELPVEVAFAGDGKTAFVLTVASVPVFAAELKNSQIASRLHRIDLQTFTVDAGVKSDVALFHLAAPPGAASVLVGGSFGLVAAQDRSNLARRAAINLSNTPMPVMGINF